MNGNASSGGPPVVPLQPTDEIWREVLAQLRAFVRRRIADPERAEDLVGEILLRVHQNLASLDDRERLPNWVFRVARNAVIDEYRRAGRAREQLAGSAEAAWPEPSADADNPDDVLEELSRCLRPLLTGLAPEQRRAVEMIDLDGLTQASAARREGVSLSGMKSRVQRGRRRLAQLLGECCLLTLDARGVPMDYARPPAPAPVLAAAPAEHGGRSEGRPPWWGGQLQLVLVVVSWAAQLTAQTEVDARSGLTGSVGLSSVTAKYSHQPSGTSGAVTSTLSWVAWQHTSWTVVVSPAAWSRPSAAVTCCGVEASTPRWLSRSAAPGFSINTSFSGGSATAKLA